MSGMSHLSLPTTPTAADPVAPSGVPFSDMDVRQQAAAVTTALHDPMGWIGVSIEQDPEGTDIRLHFTHPIGVQVQMERALHITFDLCNHAEDTWDIDPSTRRLFSTHIYKTYNFLNIYEEEIGRQRMRTFDLSDFQDLLECNFSQKGQDTLCFARQILAGYILSCDPVAQGHARLYHQYSLPRYGIYLGIDNQDFLPFCAAVPLIRICVGKILLALAGIGHNRMDIQGQPFRCAMSRALETDLPTSAHARVAAIQAYTDWMATRPHIWTKID